MRILGGAAVAAMLVLALTGCGSQATQPASSPSVTVAPTTAAPPPSTPPASTPAPTTTRTATATATPTSTGTGAAADPGSPAPANQCANDALGVSVRVADGGGGAGSEYYNVLFTNTGGSACALRGTPGVSVVGDGNGTQLGEPADRIQTGVKTVTLAVGATVAAPLKVVNIGTDGGPLEGCTVRKGQGYRVYPPHSTRAFFVRDPNAVACVRGPSFMTVSPVIRFTD